MNRSLFLSVHALVALALVIGTASWGVLAKAATDPASRSAREFVFWSGWVALALFLAAYAYVLRKRAHKLGYSPEFGLQVRKEAMEAAQQRLGALRDKVAARQLQDKGQVLDAARAILRETGCSKVLVARVVAGDGGLLRLETSRAEPLSRMARWLHAHLYYGVAACALAFLHGGARFDTPMSIAINSLVLLVLASGVVGILLWAWGPGWLTREERDLSIEEAFVLERHYARRVEAERARIAAVEPALASAWASGSGGADMAERLAGACGGGTEGDKRARELMALAGQGRKVRAELARLERVRFLINAWRPVHIPASIALLAAILVHVLAIWLY